MSPNDGLLNAIATLGAEVAGQVAQVAARDEMIAVLRAERDAALVDAAQLRAGFRTIDINHPKERGPDGRADPE